MKITNLSASALLLFGMIAMTNPPAAMAQTGQQRAIILQRRANKQLGPNMKGKLQNGKKANPKAIILQRKANKQLGPNMKNKLQKGKNANPRAIILQRKARSN